MNDQTTPVTNTFSRHGSFVCRLAGALVACTFAFGAAAGPAAAATASPAWSIRSVAEPTNFPPGDSSGNDFYKLVVTNTGSVASDGSPVTITDVLPAGVTPTPAADGSGAVKAFGYATVSGGSDPFVSCTTTPVQCTYSAPVGAGQVLEMDIAVKIDPGASGSLTNTATVSGGGAQATTSSAQNPVSSTPAPFGITDFSFNVTGADGAPDSQAGAHPYAVTTTLDLTNDVTGTVTHESAESIKDTVVDLPLGFVGDPQAAPRCPLSELQLDASFSVPQCPPDTKIGEVAVTEPVGFASSLFPPLSDGGVLITNVSSLYNLVPEQGHPAEFGFNYAGSATAILYGSVIHTDAGYVLRVTSPNTPSEYFPNTAPGFVSGFSLTFFGDPRQHSGTGSAPFFTNPTDCSGVGGTATVHVDSWEHPGRVNADGSPDFSGPNWLSASSTLPPVTGCNALQFKPTLTVGPDTTVADSPAGVDADLEVPQAPSSDGALATPDLKDATVTLPVGVSLSPSVADGLAGCTDQQIAVDSTAPATCPDASQIGTVQITTPLLPDPMQGQIYLGTPDCSPCTSADAASGAMFRGYIQAQGDGVLVKLPGSFAVDPQTGQITAHFDDNPQLPFSDLQLQFKGGPRGVIDTPDACGTYASAIDLSPWSSPDTPDATSSDAFTIGSGCMGGFAPSFTAGVSNPQAGAFSPFVLSFQRSDTDQYLSGLSVTLPPGMLAKLAGVAECSDAELAAAAASTGIAEQANPSCPSGSQVGTVQTGAGAGSSPFFLPGNAYLTGPYKGAPYGLAVVVPALAGPYDLGTVVVRQALYVDPTTAQVTAVSDPVPTILDGIPLRIRRIDVDLNRPDFTLNPTSCNPMAITGTLTSTGGLSSAMSSRFQVGGCQELAFSPKLKMSLTGKGKTGSGDHPALVSTLTQPFGQANLHTVKVTLPLSMALDPNNSQHVCNYAVALAVHGGAVGCPASTIVGTATAVTPLLSQPLTGKVYLVQGIRFSHGNRIRTLPSLLVPLRGQIALDLRAKTSVNAGSALVTTFSTIPDAAVSKFTLTISGGKKGLLVITGRGRTICGKPQITGATLGAQSGKTENSSIKMSTPCGKTKPPKAKKHGKKTKKHDKK